ncbi:putative f-box domain-containing protein [Botrytis fragariae]|uniref:Putative f-box domain-containing protein n=1 Tax=Botrytis fragariae TaxID=1964551 RepID=A0A8H6AXS9_9HELO|nr:putative f-box domain-containing protein [Botrytis fragariae]KAF5875768.1 putative f-box domain-containing protein [Botrytis fragariae]
MSTFTLFHSFPAEIHGLILEQCPPNDRTCLRLTCKYLYTLSPPKYPVSLDYSPTPEVFCSKPEVSHISPGVHKQRFPIRKCGLGAQLCHDRSLHYINILRAAENLPPLTRKKCRDHYWGDHCECFSRSKMLHKQLQKWMPKDMKYCSECSVFTKRRKSKKFRCEYSLLCVYEGQDIDKVIGTHGRKKQFSRNSHITSNLWTNHKGRGGYYHKLWKKWFNNSAFDNMEARLRLGKRNSNSRYNLRKEYMPRARYLDTTWSRHE